MKRIKKILFTMIISLSLITISPLSIVGQGSVAHVQAKTKYVYITETGSKYHKEKCGNGKYYKTTLAKAKKANLEPCSKCYNK